MSSGPVSQSIKRGRPVSQGGGAEGASDDEANPEHEEAEDAAANAMLLMLSGAGGSGEPSSTAQVSGTSSRRPRPRPKGSSRRSKGRKKAARVEGSGGETESDSDASALPNFIKQRNKRPIDEYDDLQADELEEIADALKKAEVEYREARQLGATLTDLVGTMVLLRPHPARWWSGAAARVNFFLGEDDLAALRASGDTVAAPQACEITTSAARIIEQDGLMGTLYPEVALLRRALQIHGRAGFLRRRALLEDVLDDVEDALREGEDDEMVALDDFAERVNRAQREEAEAQHGLRSDWWWPKAETIEEAKKEREGRCTLPVAIQALGVSNYVVMAVDYTMVPPEHRLSYRFGPVFECHTLLDEVARRGKVSLKQRYQALYRERRVRQVRTAVLQGGGGDDADPNGVLVTGNLVDGSGVRLGLWKDVKRLKFQQRDKTHLIGAKWLTRDVAVRFLNLKHRDLSMTSSLPPLEPHSDGLPGSLYNDRDLQALAVAVGDVGLQNRLDLFLAGMDKAAALARARNEALHDKARELQEEREEEDEATDRWTEATVKVFWGLDAQDLEELEVEMDGDQGDAAGSLEKSWSTAVLVAAGMRKHGRLGGLMRHMARVEERWLQTREEARDVRKRLLAFMQEEEEDEAQEEIAGMEEGKEATFRRLDGDEANTWMARDEAQANFLLTQHDLMNLPHSGRRWTADATVEYNQRALREAAEAKYGQAYDRRRQAMEHAWIKRICQRLCQSGNGGLVLHPPEKDDEQASWWERLHIIRSGIAIVGARSKVGVLVEGEPSKRGATWAQAMYKMGQEVVQRRKQMGEEAKERRLEAMERAERLLRDRNLVEVGIEGPGVGQPMWKTAAAQSDTADEGNGEQQQEQQTRKQGQKVWRQLLAVSVPTEPSEEPDEGGQMDQRRLTYEVRPMTRRHAVKAWAMDTPLWRDVCSYLIVYREAKEGVIPLPPVCKEWDGSAEGSVRDMWGEVVVLEGVELERLDEPLVQMMRGIVEAAYDKVRGSEDWWIGEEERPLTDLLPGPVCEWALVELEPILEAVRQWRREGGYGETRALPMPLWVATPNQPTCMLLPPVVFESLRLALPGPEGEAEMRRFLDREVMAWATCGAKPKETPAEPPPEPKEKRQLQRAKPQRHAKLAAALREGLEAGGDLMKRLGEVNPVVVMTKEGLRIPQEEGVRADGAWMSRQGHRIKPRAQPLRHFREISGCSGPACDVRRLCDVCRQCLAEHCGCAERRDHQRDRLGLPSRLLPEVGAFRRYHDAVLRERVHVRLGAADVVEGGPASWALYPGAVGAGEELGNPNLTRELKLTRIENALHAVERAPTGDLSAPPPRELLDYIQTLVHKERSPLARAVQGSLDESALVALGVLVEEAVGALMDQVVKRGRADGEGMRGVREFDVDDAVRSVVVHVGREAGPEDVGRVLGTLYGPPEEEWGEEMEDRIHEVMTRLRTVLVGMGGRQEGAGNGGDPGVEEEKGGGT